MTATEQPKAKTAGGWAVLAVVLLSLGVLPLVGHGCHGDDVDHEPVVAPLPQKPDFNQP